MSLRLQTVNVSTGSHDTESQLLFYEEFLVAVLVHLSDDYEDDAGKWFLEAGFGPVDTVTPPTFDGLDEAQTWIEQRLGRAA